jgi:hypothetical protein
VRIPEDTPIPFRLSEPMDHRWTWYEDDDVVQFVVTVRKREGYPLRHYDQAKGLNPDVGRVRKAIVEYVKEMGMNLAISGDPITAYRLGIR